MNKWQQEVYDMLRAASRNYLPCTIPADLVHIPANMMLDADNRSKWTSVEERLPEMSGEYLVIVKAHGGQSVLNYSAPHKLFNAYDGASSARAKQKAIEVSYWMPLPEPPKEEE